MIRSKTAVIAAVLLSCAAPNTQEMFTPVSLTAATASEVNSAFEALADSADKSLHVALPTLTDIDLAQAIVDAHERGVLTKVVVDSDARDTDGVALLQAADVPLVLATDGMEAVVGGPYYLDQDLPRPFRPPTSAAAKREVFTAPYWVS